MAGGFNGSFSNVPGQQTFVFPRFAFVPTFSAVDYRGALNNDADYTININDWLDGNQQVRADRQNLTPFRAIYGDNFNDQHPFIGGEGDAIRALARNEFGINTDIGGCQVCGGGTGLASTYFNNNNLVNDANNRTDNTNEGINFSSDEQRFTPFWGSTQLPNIPPFNGQVVGRANISARWGGSFEAPVTATYTFNMRTDDGTRVWFDGVQRADDWGNYPPKDHKFTVSLNAGQRKNIIIEWFQGIGGYEAKLFWEINGVPSIIPNCRLFPTSVVATDCNFTVAASANSASVSCGGTSQLSATCSGSGCTGVTYAWSGNSSNYSGSPVDVTLPSSNGSVSYTLTGSKSGCSNQTANTSVTVSGCGGSNPDRTENGTASDGGANNPNGEGEAQAFDNQNSSKWLVFTPTGNIVYDFANEDSYAISSYTVTSANDEPARDPKNWNFQGSNDGSNWTTINSQNDQFYGNRSETKTFDISNTTAYRQYRLDVTGNNGSSLLQIAEVQMFGILGTGGGTTGGGTCSYTEGQFLTNWYGEIVNAYRCGSKYYASSTGGAYKPKSWLIATGRFSAAEYNCFEQDDPRPAGCASTGGGGGGGGGTGGGGTGGTGGCTFTDGQYLLDYNGETIQAKLCNGVLYARATWGAWKHPNWLIGAGMNATTAACFATSNPGCGALRVSAEKLSEETDDKITVYPNPTTGKIKIVFALQKAENVWLNLYDVQGKSLDLRDFEGKVGRNEMEYDLQNYSSGSYFVDFQSAGKHEVLKVIKVN